MQYTIEDSWSLGVATLGGMASGQDGTVYIIDSSVGQARSFTSDGAPVATYDFASDALTGSLPNDIAIGQNGDVYILDQDANRVLVFAPDGTLLSEWGGAISFEPGTPFDARAITVDDEGKIYLADPTPRIQVFTRDGTLLDVWESLGDELLPQQVQDMELVNETLYVLGTFRGSSAVVPLTLTGILAGEPIIFMATGDERALTPTSCAVAADGAVFVVDPIRFIVARVAPDGAIEASLPVENPTTGAALKIATDSTGRVLLANGTSHIMTVYTQATANQNP